MGCVRVASWGLHRFIARTGASATVSISSLLREHDARLASCFLQIERSDAPDLFVDITITVVGIVDIVWAAVRADVLVGYEMRGGDVAAPILPGQGSVRFIDQLPPMQAEGFRHGGVLIIIAANS